jgi:hypothetical protein
MHLYGVTRRGSDMAATPPTIDSQHAVEDAVAEMHDELYRLADHIEGGNYNEARESKRTVEGYLSALDQYITQVSAQEE